MPAPVISVAKMREWERATWAAGRTQSDVISRVGHIVGNRARKMTRRADLVVILAGRGHNGDDARQASQNLTDREICLINVTDPDEALTQFKSNLSLQPALVIDGLFGIGLNRPLELPWIRLVEEINQSGIPILSVDVPSGLNAETGEPHGAAVQASLTLTLGAPKRGLLEHTAWNFVGRLEVAPDIGLIPGPPPSDLQWTLAEDFAGYPPPRPVFGHKGTFGHVAILAGSLGYHGAAVLAARGALRARPGLVSVFTLEDVYIPVACQLQAAMVHPWQRHSRLPDSARAILVGPGLAAPEVPESLRTAICTLWAQSPLPVIADASALDMLPPGPTPAGAIRVITPHPGEAARMLKTQTSAIQESRVKAVPKLSKCFGDSWVVLKGHQTLVGRSRGTLFVNSSGNPCLGQGGSGDVLAGFLAGILAQPRLQSDPETAIRFAAWQHGATADYLDGKNRTWTVESLIESLGNS